MKKISVNLPDDVVKALDEKVVGKFGKDYSDALCAIISNWLVEQGFLKSGGKKETHESKEEHLPGNEPFYTS